MTLDELKNEIDIYSKIIDKKVFEKEQLEKNLQLYSEEIESLKEKKNNSTKGSLLLKSLANDTRKQSLEIIENMITQAIKPMYGDDYEFSFRYNEKSLEKGEKSGFNIQPSITSEINGHKITTSIKNSRGGGLLEVMSVLLRFAVLKLCNYNGVIVLDETWASLSADDKMVNLIDFIDVFIKETDIQVLFITHRAEMFGKNADNIIYVDKSSGIANIKNMSYDDILNLVSAV
jgi:hypothetical protein